MQLLVPVEIAPVVELDSARLTLVLLDTPVNVLMERQLRRQREDFATLVA